MYPICDVFWASRSQSSRVRYCRGHAKHGNSESCGPVNTSHRQQCPANHAWMAYGFVEICPFEHPTVATSSNCKSQAVTCLDCAPMLRRHTFCRPGSWQTSNKSERVDNIRLRSKQWPHPNGMCPAVSSSKKVLDTCTHTHTSMSQQSKARPV